MTASESLLTAMLDCGKDDLSLLKYIEYPWEDILEQMDYPESHSLNAVLDGAFSLGIIDIKDWIAARLEKLATDDMTPADPEYQQEYKALQMLDPDNDIQYCLNAKCTDVWITNNKDVYLRYCRPALHHFEAMTGFCCAN